MFNIFLVTTQFEGAQNIWGSRPPNTPHGYGPGPTRDVLD